MSDNVNNPKHYNQNPSGGQPSPFSDAQVRKALKKGKTAAAAAKILKCAKVTVTRRLKEWELAEAA